VFCHVLRKRTLHNVYHQHENIQILQLLLNTYIHHCVKRRSTTSDISEWERHCQQNLHVATEGKNLQVFVWMNCNVKKAPLQPLKADLVHESSTQSLYLTHNFNQTQFIISIVNDNYTNTIQLQGRMNCNWLQLDYKQNCKWPKSRLHLSTQRLKHIARPTSEWNKNKYIQTHLAESQA